MKREELDAAKELSSDLGDLDALVDYLKTVVDPKRNPAIAAKVEIDCFGEWSLEIQDRPAVLEMLLQGLSIERIRIIGELEKIGITV